MYSRLRKILMMLALMLSLVFLLAGIVACWYWLAWYWALLGTLGVVYLFLVSLNFIELWANRCPECGRWSGLRVPPQNKLESLMRQMGLKQAGVFESENADSSPGGAVMWQATGRETSAVQTFDASCQFCNKQFFGQRLLWPVTLDSPNTEGGIAGNEDQSNEASEMDKPAWHQRPMVYAFQHVALRQAAFDNHPELARMLNGEDYDPFSYYRARAEMWCEDAGLIKRDFDDSDEATEREMEREVIEAELFSTVVVRRHQRGGYTTHVITMPKPVHMGEAHFVAVVTRDGEPRKYMEASPSTRYLTLEKTDGGSPLLCEWLRDGRHENYGPGTSSTEKEFAEAVFTKVLEKPGY